VVRRVVSRKGSDGEIMVGCNTLGVVSDACWWVGSSYDGGGGSGWFCGSFVAGSDGGGKNWWIGCYC
jgi:hypothetical protein